MNKKVRWITETAVILALLVALQALTKGFGQFVTGSCVNFRMLLREKISFMNASLPSFLPIVS